MTPGKIRISTICRTCQRRLDPFAPSDSRPSSYTTVFPGRVSPRIIGVVVVEVRLTCVINVVANLFEKPDRFRNAPPPRIKVLGIEHSGKFCRRVRSTTWEFSRPGDPLKHSSCVGWLLWVWKRTVVLFYLSHRPIRLPENEHGA